MRVPCRGARPRLDRARTSRAPRSSRSRSQQAALVKSATRFSAASDARFKGAMPARALAASCAHPGVRPVARLFFDRSRRRPAVFKQQAAIIVHIAVIRRDRAVRDQPQPVGAGFDQIGIMADQDHRAVIFVEPFEQRGAAFDVEMVGRLVEDQQMRRHRTRRAPAPGAPSRRRTASRLR